ncbi:MAG: hypothetical protein AB8B93_17250, partial [Pseudomonadales bacterium]
LLPQPRQTVAGNRNLGSLFRQWRTMKGLATTGRRVPLWLVTMLAEHREQFSPRFDGYLSDHFPMTALAMWQLRQPRDHIEHWAARYRPRLDQNQDASYRAACGRYDVCIERDGIEATVRAALPPLLSGWVKDAFHPTIRLAYGLQFGVPGEISAGLAYLEMVGTEPLLADYAATGRAGQTSKETLVWPQATALPGRTFSDKAAAFLRSPAPAPLLFGEATLSRYADAVLRQMLSTGDFFALHLVTGLDAFRIATGPLPHTQQHWLAAGMLAGCAAAELSPTRQSRTRRQPQAFHTDTEHDFKVVLACRGLAAATKSRIYRETAHYFHISAIRRHNFPT